jgi:hypothetical protein
MSAIETGHSSQGHVRIIAILGRWLGFLANTIPVN